MVALVDEVLRNSQWARRRTKRAALYDLGAATIATLALWRQRAREQDELAQLDWRELKDIGLTTADVQQLLDKPFWRA